MLTVAKAILMKSLEANAKLEKYFKEKYYSKRYQQFSLKYFVKLFFTLIIKSIIDPYIDTGGFHQVLRFPPPVTTSEPVKISNTEY